MSLLESYVVLARYNLWMNQQLYAAAAQLSDAERTRDCGAFFKSVHGTLNHLMVADCIWMTRFTGDPSYTPIPIRGLDHELYADFAELRAQRERLDARIGAWVSPLTEADLQAELAYVMGSGKRQAHPLWHALTHMFNHQTHHRGQITTLLKQLGVDPGVTDLIAMLR